MTVVPSAERVQVKCQVCKQEIPPERQPPGMVVTRSGPVPVCGKGDCFVKAAQSADVCTLDEAERIRHAGDRGVS